MKKMILLTIILPFLVPLTICPSAAQENPQKQRLIDEFQQRINKLDSYERELIAFLTHQLIVNPNQIGDIVKKIKASFMKNGSPNVPLLDAYMAVTQTTGSAEEKKQILEQYYAKAQQGSETQKNTVEKTNTETQAPCDINPIKSLINNAKYQRPYQILGINENATVKEIKAAQKKLAQQYHPDKYAGNKELQSDAQEAMKIINNARDEMLKRAIPLTAAAPQ